MAETFGKRIAHAWNAFLNRGDEKAPGSWMEETSYGRRPDRTRLFVANERSILSAIYVRLSIDIASLSIRHIQLDEDDRYTEDRDSGLNYCLRTSPNLDQGPSMFKQDAVLTMFDRGLIAIVPVETTINPAVSNSYEITNMRVGEIVQFWPNHVKVDIYNEQTGRHEQPILPKKQVAIVENPLYAIMNEPISTLQRLTRKLSLLDQNDEASSSGKLDMIIQLPYTIRSDRRREEARNRREEIEMQLQGSKYGIAYADATEKITQLNRPIENQLMDEIKYLTEQLYVQLGLTPGIMDGTADEAAIINYYNRTVEPCGRAIAEEMNRKFLTKTALSQGQRVDFFQNRFRLLPLSQLAEIADKFTRNEIMTGNELRQAIGMRPSSDPKADELRNSNMPRKDTDLPSEDDNAVDSAFDDIDSTIDGIMNGLDAGLGPDDEEDPEEEIDDTDN